MKRILVLRLSSMGDVLLTLPVMSGVLAKNPDVEIVFITRKKFAPYFSGIDRLVVIPFDPAARHKGLPGLLRLFLESRRYRITKVIDLHGVLRTHLLDLLFLLSGHRIFSIRKHRKLRRFILKHKGSGISVPHAIDRYREVFEKAGWGAELAVGGFPFSNDPSGLSQSRSPMIQAGISPVSKHATKNWGLQNVSKLISLLNLRYSIEIHLFGGKEDYAGLNTLTGRNVFNHAGVLLPSEEISLMRKLDIFITMDSANMHLASLAGIPTISIWGATDPKLGFAPLNQPGDYALVADPVKVYCRPCSVYGEIPCKRADSPMICMESIKPEMVLNKIIEILRLASKN